MERCCFGQQSTYLSPCGPQGDPSPWDRPRSPTRSGETCWRAFFSRSFTWRLGKMTRCCRALSHRCRSTKTMANGAVHHGCFAAFDLDANEFTKRTQPPIRPTEATIASRVPPRWKVQLSFCTSLCSLTTPRLPPTPQDTRTSSRTRPDAPRALRSDAKCTASKADAVIPCEIVVFGDHGRIVRSGSHPKDLNGGPRADATAGQERNVCVRRDGGGTAGRVATFALTYQRPANAMQLQ